MPPLGRYKATEKRYARNRIHHLYRSGQIPRARELKCVDCGKQAAEYDHYAGYEPENAEKIEPVCNLCHKEREFKRGSRPRVFYRPPRSQATPEQKREAATLRMRNYRARQKTKGQSSFAF